MNSYKNLQIIDHPLVQDRLSRLRCKDTNSTDFRRFLREIAVLMTYEVTKDLSLTTKTVQTPVMQMEASVLKDLEPVIVPILRAGLGLSEGVQSVLPSAPTGHIGMCRDEVTKMPFEYFVKLPKDIAERNVILVDPMLATGYSAKFALDILIKKGVPAKNIKFMVLVAAPEGMVVLEEYYPEVQVFTASLDDKLNENAYITPGLGDAGDRIFDTV